MSRSSYYYQKKHQTDKYKDLKDLILVIITKHKDRFGYRRITEFNVSGKKLYLSLIIDLFNGEIISYDLSERPNFNQIVLMLKRYFDKIPD